MVGDRAYLRRARAGAGLARLEAEVAAILATLGRTGARRVEPAALHPAAAMLDLYGEDIRARAFVTADEGAELMLRPDFTLPVVQLHMDSTAISGRYTYCGPVWRRQDFGSSRPREYLQAGLEIFGADDPAVADAEVLALIAEALRDAPLEIVTGDMGLALAAIDALRTSDARKAALRRHLWRPVRFHALLGRYGPGHAAARALRAELLAAAAQGRVDELVTAAGIPVGLRTADDVAARVEILAREAETRPLGGEEVTLLEAVLDVRGTSAAALASLRDLARDLPGLAPAVDRLEARLAAIAAAGLDAGSLPFEASFGRTTLEYYDGFVFGAIARGRPDLPPIASGGRYDALTRALGGGRSAAAVGGMIRPEALVALREGAA